eukprot:767614-Hanusia_phi.AAC.5
MEIAIAGCAIQFRITMQNCIKAPWFCSNLFVIVVRHVCSQSKRAVTTHNNGIAFLQHPPI